MPIRSPKFIAAKAMSFQQLPLELTTIILSPLDVSSLTNLRSVSRAVRNAVDSLPVYRMLVSRDRRFLRDVVVIGQGRHFTCTELYEAARITRCENSKCRMPYLPIYLFFPSRQHLCMSCISGLAFPVLDFHAFGIQRPADPKLHHYGYSTQQPTKVIALRAEYPYQTLSVPPMRYESAPLETVTADLELFLDKNIKKGFSIDHVTYMAYWDEYFARHGCYKPGYQPVEARQQPRRIGIYQDL